MDLSTMLAQWREGKLRQTPLKGLLGYHERSHNARQERIRESRTLTPEAKRLELNEARRRYKEERTKLRADIIAGMDESIDQEDRKANPPVSDATLGRMNLLGGVHLARWQRAAGNLIADAIEFERQGDVAGLHLARQHVGVLDASQRSSAAATIDEALEPFKTSDQRAAATRAEELKAERDEFEAGSGFRDSVLRQMNANIPPARTPSPMAGAVAPQR